MGYRLHKLCIFFGGSVGFEIGDDRGVCCLHAIADAFVATLGMFRSYGAGRTGLGKGMVHVAV